jgi:hypothetical protein
MGHDGLDIQQGVTDVAGYPESADLVRMAEKHGLRLVGDR